MDDGDDSIDRRHKFIQFSLQKVTALCPHKIILLSDEAYVCMTVCQQHACGRSVIVKWSDILIITTLCHIVDVTVSRKKIPKCFFVISPTQLRQFR